MSQAIFGNAISVLPSSSISAPLWTEERIIRLFRVLVDFLFLQNMTKVLDLIE
jgi:hypothetical protein